MSKDNWKQVREPDAYVTLASRQFDNFCRCRDFDPEEAIEKLVAFWEFMHKKCIFCQGLIVDGKCVNCGRSDDFVHELMVKMKKAETTEEVREESQDAP